MRNNYLDFYDSVITSSQKSALRSFIEQANNSTLNISPVDPTALLSSAGDMLFSVPENITDPDNYNKAVMSAITDLAALYRELDSISTGNAALDSINNAEISRIAAAVDNLERTIQHKVELNKNLLNYTDMIYENFLTNEGDMSLVPDSYRRLQVDPVDHALKRPSVGSSSRTISQANRKMCKVSVENMLGISAETKHAIDEATDGSYSTYWREVILADAPITANPQAIGWLPDTYSGGAAVRLRFDFDFITPISELSIKPITPYPMKILEVAWSTQSRNDKSVGSMIPINGNFEDSLTASGWITGSTVGATGSVSTTEGNDGGKCLKVVTSSSTAKAQWTISRLAALIPDTVYGLSFYMKRSSPNTKLEVSVGYASAESALISGSNAYTTFWGVEPTAAVIHSPDWQMLTYYFKVPKVVTSISSALQLKFSITDSGGTTWIDDIQLSNDYDSIKPNIDVTSTETLKFNATRGNAMTCKTLWVTLCQPHYDLKHYTIPEGAADIAELWTAALETPDSAVISYDSESSWRADPRKITGGKVVQGGVFMEEVNRLGGRIKDLVLQLYAIAKPSTTMNKVVKYGYILGAWEVDLRYKEYAPDGLWVSKPLDICGEIRQLRIRPQTDAASGIAKYFVTTKATDVINPDTLFQLEEPDICVYFKPGEESRQLGPLASTLVVTPITTSETFEGTDRNHKIRLSKYPYVNLERVAAIQSLLTSGDLLKLSNYDPNAETITYVTSSAARTSGYLTTSNTGYRPISVVLRFPDGTIANPDKVGPGNAGEESRLVGPESLLPDTDGPTISQIKSTTPTVTPGKRTAATGGGGALPRTGNTWAAIEASRSTKNYIMVNGRRVAVQTSTPKVDPHVRTAESILAARAVVAAETQPQATTDPLSGMSYVTKALIEKSDLKARSYLTQYPVAYTSSANRISLYWHKTAEEDGTVVTSHDDDIFIHPAHYEIHDADTVDRTVSPSLRARNLMFGYSRVVVKGEGFKQLLNAPGDSKETWELVAYYRTVSLAADRMKDYELEVIQCSGLSPLLVQGYPVTRNMTNYWTGATPIMQKANLDKGSDDYYPIYEYYVDSTGALVFADDLFRYGDIPAIATVNYSTLDINPRIVIQYVSLTGDGATPDSPSTYGYSVLVNARR